jgi:hypothetical protein
MVDTVKSINIVNADALGTSSTGTIPTPIQRSSQGEWIGGELQCTDGYCTATATGIAAAAKSTYRLVRFPVEAKIKSLSVQSVGVLDSNSTQTLAIDFNLAFSDSTVDGTSVANQGLIPTTAGAGAVTTVTSYSSPNILWGTITQAGNNAVLARTNITFNGTNFTSTTLTNTLVVPYVGYTNIPIWKLFTFVNAQGYETAPNGYFDVLAVTSVKAATGAAGSLYATLEFEM